MTDKKYAVVPWEVLQQMQAAMDYAQTVMLNEVGIGFIDVRIIEALRAIIDKGPAEPVAWLNTKYSTLHPHAWNVYEVDAYREKELTPLFRAPEGQA